MKRFLKFRSLMIATVTILYCSIFALFGAAVPLADSLRSSLKNLDKYVSLARDYDNQVEALRGTKQPDLREIAAAETTLRRLRIGLAKFQSEFRSVLSNIKSAGKWTPNLDSSFEAIAKGENPNLAQLVKEHGGARRTLEKLAAALGRLPAAFDESARELGELKAKAGGTVRYAAATSHSSGRVTCTTTITYCTVCTLVYIATPDLGGGYSIDTDLKCGTKKCTITRTCREAVDLPQ